MRNDAADMYIYDCIAAVSITMQVKFYNTLCGRRHRINHTPVKHP